jgi:hypothetical protein
MVKHDCLHEADIAGMKEQLKTLFIDGESLVKKLDDAFTQIKNISDTLIRMESYSRIKTWVMGTTITLLFGALCWSLTELWQYIHK